MRMLRGTTRIQAEIESGHLDRPIAQLLTAHLRFLAEYAEEASGTLTAVLVEPGDTLHSVSSVLRNQLLVNPYSGKRYGEPGFLPCFETLEEHPTFFEMFFIEGEDGTSVLIPKGDGIDPDLLALCAQHSNPAKEPSP